MKCLLLAVAAFGGLFSAVDSAPAQTRATETSLYFSDQPSLQEFFRARVFEEPLVPVGGKPGPQENAALAAALVGYSKRRGPDDFSCLTTFLEAHPHSPWRAALLTDLGLEYYNTAHYSLALEAWGQAWSLAKDATDARGRAIADRAAGELAYMYARLGRMTELASLFISIEGRVFSGPATERMSGARQGLANMRENPSIAFRCGPLALHRIKLSLDPKNPGTAIVHGSASTQKGFSLPQVAELSRKLGLNYQMAYRGRGAAFVVPSVVHWKLGHYAAMVREEGGRYLLQDPTFQNDVWVTKEALETETSGYFLIPTGALAGGWRTVEAGEGSTIWGRGNTCCNDPGPSGPCDPKKPGSSCGEQQPSCPTSPGPPPPPLVGGGMAVANVHLMLVSLNIVDTPVGYSPPVGPPVRFRVTYNQRDAFQPSMFAYSNLGSKWTFDWLSYIMDNPFSPSADVKYYLMGGGTRTFTGFDTSTQTFAHQQYDQTRLSRISTSSYEMLSPDGSRKIFSQPDGSIGTARKVFLTQLIDPSGNTVSLTYDALLRVVALTDAIGQVTTLSYELATDPYKITKVTDPFGRSATFAYDISGRLTKVTDVIGIESQFAYDGPSDFISALITPYGTNSFSKGESGTTRWLETRYPDGDRDRVEYNQSTTLGIAASDPPASVPVGMGTHNDYLYFRNTYYWSKIACASGYGDYTKAKIYHWLHTADLASTAGILESTKEALEGRVWFDYAGQSDPVVVGTSNRPIHAGRVLDDGSTQLYTYEYDAFGHVTKTVDPVGRTFSYLYSTNGVDLLEIRMTRNGANDLLETRTYNGQHLPLTQTDAAGQTTTYAYNSRGRILARTNPKGETTTFGYDPNGYLISVDGPLPGTNDTTTWAYDAFGRVRTQTDVSGHTLTTDYDNLDRLTRITFPDSTFEQLIYDRLDLVMSQDRAGRQTAFEYNAVRQMTKRTDPLGRATLFQWCKCGDARSLTDPMGRTTTWHHDVQGRATDKQFADGSKITYLFEKSASRLRQVMDEKGQVTQYSFNLDDTVSSISYANALVPTKPLLFTYDSSYLRETSMTDFSGTTFYTYMPISVPATLGAGQLASIEGPLPNSLIVLAYDELARPVCTTVNGVASKTVFDPAGRVVRKTNALGEFNYTYDGPSLRLLFESYHNVQTNEMAYGDNLVDRSLQRITHWDGAIPSSEFLYSRDIPAGRITSWSQQTGTHPPSIFTLKYDAANELISANVTNGTTLVHAFAYTYDPAGNRLQEQIDTTANVASYNALNQITFTSAL